MIAAHPLTAIGEIFPGVDLAAVLLGAIEAANIAPERFDVLVVTQKIVSKAEGRFVRLSDVTPGPRALELATLTEKEPRLVELILSESSEVLRAVPGVLITRHRSGHIMANAGIDQSNVGSAGEDCALLLPVDADASAGRLRRALAEKCSKALAVVISDSFGRPWRIGTIGVAIGVAGFPAVIDHRGEMDRDGRKLQATEVALADMVASAAALVTGEAAEGIPAVLLRGLQWDAEDRPAAALVRPAAQDLFR